MPELPEVETVKNVLKKIVIGHTITSIDVLRLSTIHGDIDEFKNALIGQKFLDISRIGKFLIFHLTNNVVFISHLRMEGKYFEVDENEPNTHYSRVVFHLDNNHKICYDDSRCFGMMKLSSEDKYKNLSDISSLGPEPFDIKDVQYLIDRNKKNNNPIKSTLLDQTLMTGLGNIYADEVLFASKIHPLTCAKDINKEEWKRIVDNSVRILNTAIEDGGSTIRSYHPGKDIDGNFQTKLLAYGNKDKPCVNCHHLMRFMKVNGRGTTYCPNCQKRKTNQLKVAIYGKVASGKSTVLDIFHQNGCFTISSDAIVHQLYKQESVSNLISEAFNLPRTKEVDVAALRGYISEHPKDKKKLEKLVHPRVKNEILQIFKKEKNSIIVVEVPLLYESKMDNLFDVVIAVDIPLDKQIERLNKRNAISSEELMKINASHRFDQNKEKADFIISNDSDLSNLKENIEKIICKLKCFLG